MKKRWIAVIAVGFVILLILAGSDNKTGNKTTDTHPEYTDTCSDPLTYTTEYDSRPFYMGVTTWPPGPTTKDITTMYAFIKEHADLTAHHFDGGVPWPEALSGSEFSSHIKNEWKGKRTNTPEDHMVYVAITPLNDSRNGLALYWGDSNNMPLPGMWNTYAFNSTQVKTAYLNYSRRVIQYFNPDYFAIGIEVNILLTANTQKWLQYKELHEYVYTQLKEEYPDLPMFASVTLQHIQGLDNANSRKQYTEIKEFMEYNDILGVSAYPYGWAYSSGKEDPLPDDYFDDVLHFGKPVAITETGAPSQNFSAFGVDYTFDEDYQKEYIALLLEKAYEYKFVFVVNWASIDFVRLLDIFPKETRELGMIWVYTGLQRSDGCPKKALYVWDAYLQLEYDPVD